MKTLLVTLCAGLAGALCVHAQEAGKTKTNTTTTAAADVETKVKQEELISSEEILSSIKKSGLNYDDLAFSDDALSQLTIDTNNVVEKVYTNDLTRLELKRVQITGTATPVLKKPTFGTFLQLFNPFAPAEYGGLEEPVGKASSRAFADPIRTQPTSALISVGNRPGKGED